MTLMTVWAASAPPVSASTVTTPVPYKSPFSPAVLRLHARGRYHGNASVRRAAGTATRYISQPLQPHSYHCTTYRTRTLVTRLPAALREQWAFSQVHLVLLGTRGGRSHASSLGGACRLATGSRSALALLLGRRWGRLQLGAAKGKRGSGSRCRLDKHISAIALWLAPERAQT